MIASLDEAVSQTLETMCFTGVVRPLAPEEGTDCTVRSRVSFDGDAAGVLHVQFSPEAALNAAANFLGQDPDELAEDQVEAVVFEIANMICGSMLSTFQPEGAFELSTPSADHAAPADGQSGMERCYQLETGALCLALEERPSGARRPHQAHG
jgi:CheY-specific phosphatase CheX